MITVSYVLVFILIVFWGCKDSTLSTSCKVFSKQNKALWNGVVSAATPRVTRAYSLGGQFEGFPKGMFLKGLHAVLAAGRRVAATARQQGRQHALIQAYDQDGYFSHEAFSFHSGKAGSQRYMSLPKAFSMAAWSIISLPVYIRATAKCISKRSNSAYNSCLRIR